MNGLRQIVEALGSIARKMIYGSRAHIEVSIDSDLPTFWEKFKVKPGGFRPSWIIVHHSASADGVTRDWDAIRKYHMSYRYRGEIITQAQYEAYGREGKVLGLEKPWTDVGYHFGIEIVDGKLQVMAGRGIGEVGAHCTGFNGRSIGICCVGNFDTSEPSNDLLFLVASLCRQLQLEYKIPRDQVIGHRESYARLNPPVAPQKTCPGSKFDMEAFRKRLRD